MVFKKTIVHIYSDTYPFSFGEFVRGTFYLLSFAINYPNIQVQVNIENHAMAPYVNVNNYVLPKSVNPQVYYSDRNVVQIKNDLAEFVKGSYPIMYVTTNMEIPRSEVTPQCVLQFSRLVGFTSLATDAVTLRLKKDLLNVVKIPVLTEPYNVIYMFLQNSTLSRSDIQSLAAQIQLSANLKTSSIVISNNLYLRNTLTEFLGGFHINSSLSTVGISDLLTSITDYILLSNCQKISSYSEYNAKTKKVSYDVKENRSLAIINLPIRYIATTYAGDPTVAGPSVDGPASSAAFCFPSGVAANRFGSVFVSDTMNNTIREITPDQNVRTVAGSMDQLIGSTDASGSDARFNGPTGLTVGIDGTIYVLDAINARIRKIDVSGNVTTLAGSSDGFQDGSGTGAKFKFVYGQNNTIQVYITTTVPGSVSVLDGSPVFAFPSGVATDISGSIYVCDTIHNAVRQLTPDGSIVDLALSDSLAGPTGLTVASDGTVYVVDAIHNEIKKIGPGGTITTIAGGVGSQFNFVYGQNNFVLVYGTSTIGNGTVISNILSYPSSMTTDSSGSIYVCDTMNNRIWKINSDGSMNEVSELGGSLNGPTGIAVGTDGTIYVVDAINNQIKKIAPDGTLSVLAGGGLNAQFNFLYENTNLVYSSVAIPTTIELSCPSGIAISQNGTILSCDTIHNVVREIKPDGTVVNIPMPSNLNGPSGLAMANDGTIYVVDAINNRIQKIAPDGTATIIGSDLSVPFSFFYGNNNIVYTSTTVPMNTVITYPAGLAIGPSGTIYVCDNVNNTIQEINPDGSITIVPGSALITTPTGLAVASDGTIYVINSVANQIQKIAPDGTVTTIAGDFKFTYP